MHKKWGGVPYSISNRISSSAATFPFSLKKSLGVSSPSSKTMAGIWWAAKKWFREVIVGFNRSEVLMFVFFCGSRPLMLWIQSKTIFPLSPVIVESKG